MSSTRNNSPLSFGEIKIQPARTSQLAQQNVLASTPNLLASPMVPASTTANFVPVVPIGVSNLSTFVIPVQSPLITLTGTSDPFITPSLIFIPRPNAIKRLTDRDSQEETLSVETYSFINGQAVYNINSLRCEILALLEFKSIYDNSITINSFGSYFEDLYQSSILRDSLRKYLLVNRVSNSNILAVGLDQLSTRITQDIDASKGKIAVLDSLIYKIKNINNVLDVKNSLSDSYVFTNPSQPLRQFFTSMMLFSEQTYNIFSDTKVLYQLLFDLGGIVEKCSFNLLSNFTDFDRTNYVKNSETIRQQTVQDSVTIDLTYGDNLKYNSKTLKGKYINDSVSFNGILNSLPPLSTNRFKFITNLLSKEMRISKGLGKYKLPESKFFGFKNQGNPFDSIIGTVPNDIFSEPVGNNSLSTLFYIKTGNQNVVVLPFENRQVVGDNETVFVPGSVYFSDGILKGDLSSYNTYREVFSTRITNAKTVVEKLLTQQSDNDKTSKDLVSTNILNKSLGLYKISQDFIRGINFDSTSVLSFILFLSGNSNPKIKFEVFKMLLLIILYNNRRDVSQNVLQTDKFRDLLFNEMAQQKLQGFTDSITEENIGRILDLQISLVKNLLLNTMTRTKSGKEEESALQNTDTAEAYSNAQREQLGKEVAQPFPQRNNPNNSSIQIAVQQFTQLTYCLRGEQNLLKNVVDLAKSLFTAGSDDDNIYYIIENSTLTRFNNVSVSGFLLMVFEMFSSLVDQFAKPNMSYNLIDGFGSKNTDSQYIRFLFVGNSLESISNSIRQFQIGATYNNPIIDDYSRKLQQEDEIIDNIILFFDRMNSQMKNVVAPSPNEISVLSSMSTTNPNSLSTARTAKNTLNYILNKLNSYNPTGNPSLNFYLPSGKSISDKNYVALKSCLKNHRFLSGKNKIATVGIPYGFTDSALSARLYKSETYNGKLQQETNDVINIKVYKLNKNNEAVIYKPQSIKFDLSLFAKGFDRYPMELLANQSYDQLVTLFEFYDFDEDNPFTEVIAENAEAFSTTDPYYSISQDRRDLAKELSHNLFQSFMLDLYLHLLTGLNTAEETYIKYSQNEINTFNTELGKIGSGAADLSKVKLMSPEYKTLLDQFKDKLDDVKLMLTLCNDIPGTVFREKEYDRTYTIMFDSDKFPIDVEAMSKTVEGKEMLGLMYSSNQVYTEGNELYKYSEDFVIDQYFINVELIQ